MQDIMRCANCVHECDQIFAHTAIREMLGRVDVRRLATTCLTLESIGCTLSPETIEENVEDLISGEAKVYGGRKIHDEE